jgi:predicted transcriptional regulator
MPSASTAQTVLPSLPLQIRRHRRAVRSQRSIMLAILEACRTPTVQHWIMVKARLGYDTFWKHMNMLVSKGMMDTSNDGYKTLYFVNQKGIEYLKTLESIRELNSGI